MEKEYYDLKVYVDDECVMILRELSAEELIVRIRVAKRIYLLIKGNLKSRIKNSLKFEVE